MEKSDFRMKCECGNDDIVIYSSVQQSMIGYYCTDCRQIFMFDEYEKLDSYQEDLDRLRQEYMSKKRMTDEKRNCSEKYLGHVQPRLT